jgi:hypothetical protein
MEFSITKVAALILVGITVALLMYAVGGQFFKSSNTASSVFSLKYTCEDTGLPIDYYKKEIELRADVNKRNDPSGAIDLYKQYLVCKKENVFEKSQVDSSEPAILNAAKAGYLGYVNQLCFDSNENSKKIREVYDDYYKEFKVRFSSPISGYSASVFLKCCECPDSVFRTTCPLGGKPESCPKQS